MIQAMPQVPPVKTPEKIKKTRQALSEALEKAQALAAEAERQEEQASLSRRRQEEIAREEGNVDSALLQEIQRESEAEVAAKMARIKIGAAAERVEGIARSLEAEEAAFALEYDRAFEANVMEPKRARVATLRAELAKATEDLQVSKIHGKPHLFAKYYPDSFSRDARAAIQRSMRRAGL